MTTRLNFTKAALMAIPRPKVGRTYVYDVKTAALTLCVTSAGGRMFYRYGRINGRPTRMKLGDFPAMSVEQARRLAGNAAAAIGDGKDPRNERRAIRAEATLNGAFAAYLELHLKPHTRGWPGALQMYENHLAGPLGPRRLSDIATSDVSALHIRIGRENGRYLANRILELVRATINHAIRNGWEGGGNPAANVSKFKELSRDRFLGPDELRRFLESLEAEPVGIWRDFFTTMLLTGARRSNVAAMSWDDISLDRGLWKIGADQSKSGEPMLVVLVPPAVRLLQRRALEANGSPFVFPAKTSTGYIVEPRTAWTRLLNRAEISDFRMHDVRRTVGSLAAAAGYSLPIIGKLLGHRSLSSTAIYARLDVSAAREAMTTIAASMFLLPPPEPNYRDASFSD